MGHQANDLAETALKRLFEGAHLNRLFGMRKESELQGVVIWRPFLGVPRKAIEAYLVEYKLNPLTDPSNRDPRYLRARMRLSLFPQLEEAGKNLMRNLLVLAERSSELDGYLARRAELLQNERVKGACWEFGSIAAGANGLSCAS